MKRINTFNDVWLHIDKYKTWVRKHPTSKLHACCIICAADIHLGSIRLGAIESHLKGKKHAALATSSATSIRGWFSSGSASSSSSSPSETSSSTPTATTAAPQGSSEEEKTSTNDGLPFTELMPPTSVPATAKSIVPVTTVSNFVLSDKILKAEILWVMHNNITHNSFNANQAISELFKQMFSDSHIADKFTCGRNKMSYLLTFGLAPYYVNELADQMKDLAHFVILFDESFNRVTKNEQMDVHVRFWDEQQHCAGTRYLTSKFLGHCSAKDLLYNLKDAIKHLDANKVIQISMDGPNVNHKFYRDYTDERKKMHPDTSNLVDIGSCGLHVVHGAFKTGANTTGWQIDNLLRSLWYLFADSPARRADYTTITASETFPLQFCSTRWVEDVSVAERAVCVWANVCKYVEAVSSGPKSKIPKSASYKSVCKAVSDSLTVPKLQVFIRTAKYLTPFLEQFQTDKPMVPFLATELHELLCNLLVNFLKRPTIESSTPASLLKIDLCSEKDEKLTKHVSVGFAATEAMKKVDISEIKMIEFKSQCKTFYRATAQKIIERSPLMFSFVRNLDCLNPKSMMRNSNLKQEKMFEGIISKMSESNLINSADCDDLVDQHRSFLKYVQCDHKEDFEKYESRHSLRLDKFLHNYLQEKPEFSKLWDLMKKLLILSHGQASVERGFSVNKGALKNNMSENTLIAHRVVTDALVSELGSNNLHKVYELAVTNKMMTNCRAARARYQQSLQDEAKDKINTEAGKRKLHYLSEISESKTKKQKLENTSKRLLGEADCLLKRAERESNLSLLSSANLLREKAKRLEEDGEKEYRNIELFQDKLKKLQL